MNTFYLLLQTAMHPMTAFFQVRLHYMEGMYLLLEPHGSQRHYGEAWADEMCRMPSFPLSKGHIEGFMEYLDRGYDCGLKTVRERI